MRELRMQLEQIINHTEGIKSEIETIKSEKNIYPFSVENRVMAYLLSINAITYEQYVKINQEYSMRNQYLELFEMAPRTFGESWGENHIRMLFPQFIKATKDNMSSLYPNFDGEFDLWLNGIRVEVKACRANNPNAQGSLASRAYVHEEAVLAGFKYHFQQLKPSCCDVFIWIGVCRDELLYWVLTSNELLDTGKLGPQHRNENTKVDGVGVFEGQVFMTEKELLPYAVPEKDILKIVQMKGTS